MLSDYFADLPLVEKTPERWVDAVKANFAGFLQDHASCERKAAALCMSFVAKYPDRICLIEPLVSLAREELTHFREVFQLMQRQGVELGHADEKDSYVNEMLKQLRHGREERFLDRLILSGMIEARGYERFALLAEHLEEGELQQFYRGLAKSELGHHSIFIKLAKKYFSEEEVEEAVTRIAALESAAMQRAPLTHRLH